MADAQKDLKIVLSGDTSGAESSLKSFGGSLQNITEIAAGVGLERLTEQIISLGQQALSFSINYASNLEQARIAFDAFTGSAKKGADALTQVSEFARKTPFTLPDVEQAARQILGFALAGTDNLIPMLKDVGNLAAATNQPMAVAVDLFARAKEGIFNIREFGQFGITRDELEKFGVEFKKTGQVVNQSELLPALQKLVQSRFGDLMGQEAKTFGGTVNNIKDDIGRLAAALVGVNADTGDIQKGGIFYYVKQAATEFLTALDSSIIPAMQNFNNWSAKNGQTLMIMAGIISSIVLPPLILYASTLAIRMIAALIQFYLEGYKTIAMLIVKTATLITTTAATVAHAVATGAVTLATQIWTAAQWLLNAALSANPIGLVIIAIAALAAGIIYAYNHSETFRNIVNNLWKMLQEFWGFIVKTFTPAINAIGDAFNNIAHAAENAWNWIQKVGKGGIGGIHIPGFASGVTNFGGGLALVGEQGPEIVNLPGGSSVIPNSQSKNILQKMGSSIQLNIYYPQLTSQQSVQQLVQDIKRAMGRDAELAKLGAI